MSESEQIIHFSNELDALADRYRVEYEMTYAATVGVLTMKIHLLCAEADGRSGESD